MPSANPKIAFTPQGREVVRALANLNDQYSFFLFLEYQFNEQLQNLGNISLEEYTSRVFNRNPFGPRIHVRIGKLQSFVQANRGVSFGAYLSISYEVASSFFDKAFDLLTETNIATLRIPRKGQEGPEMHYRRALIASGYPLPEKQIIDTLTYIRFRRNAIVHFGAAPKAAYQNFAAATGPSLNRYWKNSKVQINFTNPTIGAPSENDTLDQIKLLRIVTQKFDAHLASIVDIAGLISTISNRLFGTEKVRMNLNIRDIRARKLRASLKREFGFSGLNEALEAAVKNVGVK